MQQGNSAPILLAWRKGALPTAHLYVAGYTWEAER